MDKLLLEFIQAKYGLGKCDDAAVLAHLAKIGSTAEAEEADRQAKITAAANATGAPASGTPAPAPAPQIQAAGGLTEYQVNRIVANALNQNQADETARVNGITAACTEFPDLQSQAISERWTVADTQRIVAAVKIQKQKFQPATGNNIIIRNGPEITAKTLEAALSFQQGINEKTILATCGEKATEDGDKLRGITLKGVMTLCCQMENKIVGVVFDDNSIRASFTTTSLPGILSNVANKKALQNFQSQGVIATRLCSTGDLNDFKESERYRLTDMGDLQPIAADGEFKQGGLSEEKAVNQLQTFGKIITITRQMIYNDDLGLLTKIAGNLGARAARLIDQLFFRRLLSNPFTTDGKALFCADHRNFLTGTASALSLDAIKNGRTKFMQQVDKDNQPINVMPKFLLVPSALDAYAQELLTSTSVVSGATTPTPSLNIVSKFGLESISSPYLDNAAYPNSSPTGWYLFGDPNQVDTFEIGYLQGKRLPTVEHTASDFDTLGMRFRVYFDVGVREIEYRGMTFSKGVV